MYRLTGLALLVGVVMGTAFAGDAQAADRVSTTVSVLATTDEVPAALRGLNVNRSRIVTTVEAEQVRGEGSKGNAFGHYKKGGKGRSYGQSKKIGGVSSGINFGIIGGQNVHVNIINSKNVRIGSHSKVKFK